VREEFEAYLKCGRLEHGFLRVRCEDCHAEKLVAFGCKRRGFCPSCGARRMTDSAALLADEVLPAKPIRQWVLSLPFALRFLLATGPEALTRVLGIVYRSRNRCSVDSADRRWARVPERERRAVLCPVRRTAATGSVRAFKLRADVGRDVRSASRRACGFDTMAFTRTAARGAGGGGLQNSYPQEHAVNACRKAGGQECKLATSICADAKRHVQTCETKFFNGNPVCVEPDGRGKPFGRGG
jgi:hypothetical protein